MVNTGRPSAGCYLCRARRVKCDETKPGCLKCRKIGRDCPGYRDPRTARIRDETSATIDKAVRAAARKQCSLVLATGSSSPDKPLSISPTDQDDDGEDGTPPGIRGRNFPRFERVQDPTWTSHGPILKSPDTAIYYQATCFFLASHVLLPAVQGQRGSWTFVHKAISSGQLDRCFTPSFQAAALAALSSLPSHRKLRSLAHAQYLKALGEVQRAVNDPKRALETHTLGSILLLSLYETLASPNKELSGFEAHIRGAMQLVRMRGVKQAESDIGLELLILTRARYLMLHSLPGHLEKTPISDIPTLMDARYPDAFGKLTPLVNEHAHIHDEVCRTLERRRGAVAVFAKVLSLLRATKDVAKRFLAITENCPAQHKPVVERWEAFPGYEHELDGYGYGDGYGDGGAGVLDEDTANRPDPGTATAHIHPVYSFSSHWAVTLHDSCHAIVLIMLHDLCRCLAYLSGDDDYRTKLEFAEARALATRSVAQLVGSARFALELPFLSPATLGPGDRRADLDRDLDKGSPPLVPRGVVVSSMSVFAVAMASDFATEEQREYLRAKLQFVADEGGIAQADALARIESRQPRDDIERDRRRGRLS